jgi:hypothetical protein
MLKSFVPFIVERYYDIFLSCNWNKKQILTERVSISIRDVSCIARKVLNLDPTSVDGEVYINQIQQDRIKYNFHKSILGN